MHECVNWKKIDEGTKARTVDMMKPGWLVHPTFGEFIYKPFIIDNQAFFFLP